MIPQREAAAGADLQAGTDLAELALAHLGAAIMLFAEFDPAMAEVLAGVIENRRGLTR